MSAQIAITLDDDQTARLQALADSRQETAAEMVVEAVEAYLQFDADFRRAVAEGLAAVEAGDVHDFAGVEQELRIYMAERLEGNGA